MNLTNIEDGAGYCNSHGYQSLNIAVKKSTPDVGKRSKYISGIMQYPKNCCNVLNFRGSCHLCILISLN